MSALPGYVIVRPTGYSESFEPSVERTEMERGMPKQRVVNSQVLQKLHVSLLVHTAADAEAFLDWYALDIRRIGFFTMRHPRTGAMVNVRFENGDIGSLRSISGSDGLWQRDVTVEYLR